MVRLRTINMISKLKLAENNLEEATSLPVIGLLGVQDNRHVSAYVGDLNCLRN